MRKLFNGIVITLVTLASLAIPTSANADSASPNTQNPCGLFDQFFIGNGDVTDSYGNWDTATYYQKSANNTCGLITYAENLIASNGIVGTDWVKVRARYSNASGQTVTSSPVLVPLVHCCSNRVLYRITGNVPVGHYVRLEILVSTNDGSNPGDGKYCVDTSCDGWLRT